MNAFVILGILVTALLGLPVFCVLAGGALIGFARQDIAASAVISEMTRLASAPILVSIPLYTFAGYLFAESRTPERLVRLTRATIGWLPGGLAIVALFVTSILTAFTG